MLQNIHPTCITTQITSNDIRGVERGDVWKSRRGREGCDSSINFSNKESQSISCTIMCTTGDKSFSTRPFSDWRSGILIINLSFAPGAHHILCPIAYDCAPPERYICLLTHIIFSLMSLRLIHHTTPYVSEFQSLAMHMLACFRFNAHHSGFSQDILIGETLVKDGREREREISEGFGSATSSSSSTRTAQPAIVCFIPSTP